MATARLIPSSIYKTVTDSTLSIENISNAYANTDSTTYATCTGLSSSTSSVFVYIRGFNFSDVPSDATVTSFSIKVKASESGGKTSTIYACNGTSTVSAVGTATGLSTSANVHTFTGGTISWDTLKSYGSNFSIQLDCGRNKKNTTSHVYIYGAEIEVTYKVAGDEALYYKSSGDWVEVSKVYKKVSGSWVLQSNLANVFDSQTNYVKGN